MVDVCLCAEGTTRAEIAQTSHGLYCIEHQWGHDYVEEWVCLYCLIYGVRRWMMPEVED